MIPKIKLLVFIVIFSQIHQSFSAIVWELNKIRGADDDRYYTRSRSASVYRGLLLSYSPTEKNKICKDMFSALLGADVDQSSVTLLITDEKQTGSDPQHPLTVRKITIRDKPFGNKEDISFTCVGLNFQDRPIEPKSTVYILSTAFRPGWFYSNILDEKNAKNMRINNYIGLSAEYVPLDETKLEMEYITIRKNIRALEKESAEYIELVEKKDNLSSLTKWQKIMLCSTILTTPVYRNDRLEHTAHWIDHDESNLEYEKKKLLFKSTDAAKYAKEDFYADVFHCKGYINAKDSDSSASTDLYATRTYDDKDSIIVSEEDNDGRIYLVGKYFKHVPVLMNAHEPFIE